MTPDLTHLAELLERVGSTVSVEYPFHWCAFLDHEDGHNFTSHSWVPGTHHEGNQYEEWDVAEGMGSRLLHIISIHEMPKPFLPRIFYKQRWRAPDGREFGKTTLRIATSRAFLSMLRGYRWPFRLREAARAATDAEMRRVRDGLA